jgi:hypothetical protein
MAAKMPPERQLMEIAEKGGPVEELEKLIEREGQELLFPLTVAHTSCR